MCGQIFCNNCSAYSIDGAMFNQQGVVRSCQLCYEQQSQEKVGSEVKQSRRKVTEKNFIDASNAQMRELNAEYKKHHQNLQNRASAHLGAIVDRLVNSSDNITSNHAKWKELIVELVNGVVSSVDPDVRGGDCLDIRPYVKIKVIPGRYIFMLYLIFFVVVYFAVVSFVKVVISRNALMLMVWYFVRMYHIRKWQFLV